MHKLKIGDLVCYNGGGMKHKTLGIVMDFDLQSKRLFQPSSTIGYVLIMWSVVGKFMPRTSMHSFQRKPIESGDMIWHELGEWIEVVE